MVMVCAQVSSRRVSGGTARGGRAAGVVFAVVAVGAWTVGAKAQPPELVTDRPDQTESAAVVPQGRLQVETGYLFARADGVDSHAAPATLVRIGLGGRTELRLGHAGIIGRQGRQGAGDSEIGGKINLNPRAAGWRPQLALLGGLSLPTGDRGYSSDGADPFVLFAFAHDLLPRLSLGYNAGAAWESSAGQPDRDAFLVYSLVLGVSLTDRLGTFVEIFGDRQVTSAISTSASVDGGFTLLLDELVQLDLSVGRRLQGPARDLFIGTGLSFRVPR